MNAEHTHSFSMNGGHCLSTVALRQYIDGTLPKMQVHTVEKHLLDCDFCSNVLEDMDVSEEGRTVIQSISENVNKRILDLVGQAPRPSLWAANRRYFFIGGGALILLSGILIYPLRTHKETDSNIAVMPAKPEVKQTSPAPVTESETKKYPEADNPVNHKEVTAIPEKTVAVSETKTGAAHSDAVVEPPAKSESANTLNPKTDPAPAATATKKEEPKTSEEVKTVTVEKVNYADLQIVSVKVLQQMTKSSGSSRKESKNGQISKSNDSNPAYFLLEDMPNYPGGNEAMEEYLATNFKNPVKDKRTLTGKAVGVIFTVSSKGRISDVEITHSISPELDVEIIRLISSMPTWNPGKHKGDISCVLAVTVK
jgi:hypothetical protein